MPLRATVRDLKTSFASLVNEQRTLGFTDKQGITADLAAGSDAIEKIIQDDLTWVGEVDRANLLISLLTMRRNEIDYRLRRDQPPSAASSTRSSISTIFSIPSTARRR